MRLAVISDIHHHEGGPRAVLDAVRAFIDFAERNEVDAIVDLGDRLRDVSPEADRRALAELGSIFGQSTRPRVHLLGNHDVVNLDAGTTAEILAVPAESRVLTLRGRRLLAWQPDVRFEPPEGFRPAAPHLPWLREALAAEPSMPAAVVTHYPVSGQSLIGSRYFERRPDWAFPPDYEEVRTVAQEAGCALWLSGHVHRNAVSRIGGTYHVSIQSASEPFGSAPSLSYGLVELGEDLKISVQGNDWMEFAGPLPPGRPSPGG